MPEAVECNNYTALHNLCTLHKIGMLCGHLILRLLFQSLEKTTQRLTCLFMMEINRYFLYHNSNVCM